jgi:hypothetical protein
MGIGRFPRMTRGVYKEDQAMRWMSLRSVRGSNSRDRSFTLAATLVCAGALLFSISAGYPVRSYADAGGDPECYQPFPQWDQAADMHAKLDDADDVPQDTKDSLDSRFSQLQARHDGYYNGTAEQCQELRTYNSDKTAYESDLAQYNSEFNTHQQDAAQQNAECSGTVDSQEKVDRCNEWGGRIDADKARLDQWAAELQGKKAGLDQEVEQINQHAESINAEWTGLLTTFVADAQAALDDQGFTGKKVYRLTAKTWINATDVTEQTLRGVKFRLQGNNRPSGPYLNGDNDFKLFQTFTVQVDFEKGKVKHAQFLKDSLQAKVGSTYMLVPSAPLKVGPYKGVIYVTNQKIEQAEDGKSVKFTRTVEGRPNLMILYPDYFDPFASTNFATIYNTLDIKVTAGDPEVDGSGSNFPSHMFWLGDQLFHEQEQEQPSEFFSGH